mmetsp:Transcript_9946/g.15047  ORF Transcript_9946/g.15047 Transcript_9946/m.15047 type:complete len:142 (+) Transcript_9946:11-436(+)
MQIICISVLENWNDIRHRKEKSEVINTKLEFQHKHEVSRTKKRAGGAFERFVWCVLSKLESLFIQKCVCACMSMAMSCDNIFIFVPSFAYLPSSRMMWMYYYCYHDQIHSPWPSLLPPPRSHLRRIPTSNEIHVVLLKKKM